MTDAALDPSGYFEFDLARGQIRTPAGERVVFFSGSAMAPLVTSAVRNGDLTAIRKLGRAIGDEVHRVLATDAEQAPPERMLGTAADVLALFGWGTLQLERWGDALVARMRELPELDDDQLAAAALLGGMLSALAGREVACVPVVADKAFLVVDPQTAEQLWKWAQSGLTLGAIVDRLAPEGA